MDKNSGYMWTFPHSPHTKKNPETLSLEKSQNEQSDFSSENEEERLERLRR